MRRQVLLGLILLTSSVLMGADKPIPQDQARMARRTQERLEWNRQLLEANYDKVGKKNPKWDKPAREALSLAARMYSQSGDVAISLSDVHIPAKKAIDAGCDDPLILYLYSRSSVGKNAPDKAEYDRRALVAADAMAASAYSPLRRANAILAAFDQKLAKGSDPKAKRLEANQYLETIVGLLARSIKEDPRGEDWETGWYRTLNTLVDKVTATDDDTGAAFDRVDTALKAVAGIEPLRLTVKGNFFLGWGWQARTKAFAPDVPQDRFKLFVSRVKEAREALNAAWKLNPNQPHVASLMLRVEKSIGEGDREAMETWFERAMIADGNDRNACWEKLDWLDPKWYGGNSSDAMLAFANACRATKNSKAGITILFGDAQFRQFGKLGNKKGFDYIRQPEIWSGIKEVYDEYLTHQPLDYAERSKYATICAMASHISEAHNQYEILGENLIAWPSLPNYTLQTIKNLRDENEKRLAEAIRQRDNANR